MALLEHSEDLKGKHVRIQRKVRGSLCTYVGVFTWIKAAPADRPGEAGCFDCILREDPRPGDPTGTIREGGFYLPPKATVEEIEPA